VRLFVAAEIPPEIRQALAELMDALKREIPGPRWVRPEGIHLTLRFLGEVAEAELPRLAGELAVHVPGSGSPFEVRVEGMGVFPETGRPRVLWVGLVQPGGELEKLQSVVERALEATALAGVKPEGRPFRPHLTMARFGEGRPDPALAAALATRRDRTWGRFTVSSICLFQSLLGPGGATYRKLKEQKL
jgi:2'-5' RNA ligase